MKRKSSGEIQALKASIQFIDTGYVCIEILKLIENKGYSSVSIWCDKEIKEIKIIVNGIQIDEQEINTLLNEDIFKELNNISRCTILTTLLSQEESIRYIYEKLTIKNGKWKSESLKEYQLNKQLIVYLERLFENTPERKETISKIIQNIIGYHIIHYKKVIEIKWNNETCCLLNSQETMKKSYENIFHYQMKEFSTLYSFNSITIYGLRYLSKDMKWNNTKEHYIIMVNDYLICHNSLNQMINQIHCKYFSIPQTHILTPPFFLQIKIPLFHPQYPLYFEDENNLLLWIIKFLSKEFFQEILILPPPIIQYPFYSHIQLKHPKSSPPSPKKQRIFALSYSIQGRKIKEKEKINLPQMNKTKYRMNKYKESKSRISKKTIYSIAIPYLNNNIISLDENIKYFNHIIPLNKITKDDIKKIQVIGQFGKKFIICLNKTNGLLYGFDQHAVHERILFEKNWKMLEEEKSNYLQSFHCSLNIIVNSSQLQILQKYKYQFNNLNINYSIQYNKIYFNSFPILFGKQITCSEIMDIVNQIDISNEFPPIKHISIIRHIVASQSCRNAIMFNDILTLEECQKLINQLSQCSCPFICAHGRINVTPLYDYINLNK
ncbi:DNA mismatch repair protein mutL, putative [Entamoeba dispar SAW760]|uniref:DNA mismatch repair protein mutL, putative n=1 Tax=Entamoeba dispar (strain ATCC PRA-260 / SAW760) TaxID=370354 RepID=B0E7X7_ENTDS|nr:DNA mismatch repair protein mutL, putative [Entamoeba dispar SAW760]EDR29367.1 DNA mismatch repair protein mutL, putative [Entamoeba dispar SAW760]|eukprot:EDR29367.1 DNA mismatch repair protein mutL, putative [Entamoeba dispar SAW760]